MKNIKLLMILQYSIINAWFAKKSVKSCIIFVITTMMAKGFAWIALCIWRNLIAQCVVKILLYMIVVLLCVEWLTIFDFLGNTQTAKIYYFL